MFCTIYIYLYLYLHLYNLLYHVQSLNCKFCHLISNVYLVPWRVHDTFILKINLCCFQELSNFSASPFFCCFSLTMVQLGTQEGIFIQSSWGSYPHLCIKANPSKAIRGSEDHMHGAMSLCYPISQARHKVSGLGVGPQKTNCLANELISFHRFI